MIPAGDRSEAPKFGFGEWMAATTGADFVALFTTQPDLGILACSSLCGTDDAFRRSLCTAIATGSRAARGELRPDPGRAIDIVLDTGPLAGHRMVAVKVVDTPIRHYLAAFVGADQPFDGETFVSIALTSGPIVDELRLEGHLRREVARHLELFGYLEKVAKIGVWELNPDTSEAFWSDEIYRIHGIAPGGPVPLADALSFFPPHSREALEPALRRAIEEGTPYDLELDFVDAQGRERRVRTIGERKLRADGQRNLHGVLQDITEQHSARQRLWRMANFDPETELPNRRHVTAQVGLKLAAAAEAGHALCVIIFDVENLRLVNNQFGHSGGDELLKTVANRIVACAEEADVVGRFKGDEFVVAISNVTNDTDLEERVARYEAALRFIFQWGGASAPVRARGGYAVFPDHGQITDDLYKAADLALAMARCRPEGGVVRYDPSLGEAELRRAMLLADARIAARENAFVPFYQPQIDLETGAIVGVEVLARWHVGDGFRTAAEFVPALADYEICPMIGRSVLSQAIPQLRAINARLDTPLRVSINAAPAELRSETTKPWRYLHPKSDKMNIRPLVIEITEDVVLEGEDVALRDYMDVMTGNGVEFALDDFGTGYASLIHLASLPIHEIKIDRRFVQSIETDAAARGMLAGILKIAEAMHQRLVVEGVERKEQEDALRALGCRYVQGYLYSPPVHFGEFARMLGLD